MTHSSGLVRSQVQLGIFHTNGYCFLHSGIVPFTGLAAVNMEYVIPSLNSLHIWLSSQKCSLKSYEPKGSYPSWMQTPELFVWGSFKILGAYDPSSSFNLSKRERRKVKKEGKMTSQSDLSKVAQQVSGREREKLRVS